MGERKNLFPEMFLYLFINIGPVFAGNNVKLAIIGGVII